MKQEQLNETSFAGIRDPEENYSKSKRADDVTDSVASGLTSLSPTFWDFSPVFITCVAQDVNLTEPKQSGLCWRSVDTPSSFFTAGPTFSAVSGRSDSPRYTATAWDVLHNSSMKGKSCSTLNLYMIDWCSVKRSSGDS